MDTTDGRAQMARAAAVLLGLASVVNLLGIVLPHRAGVDVGGYITLTVAAAALCLLFRVGGERLPLWVFHGPPRHGGPRRAGLRRLCGGPVRDAHRS